MWRKDGRGRGAGRKQKEEVFFCGWLGGKGSVEEETGNETGKEDEKRKKRGRIKKANRGGGKESWRKGVMKKERQKV